MKVKAVIVNTEDCVRLLAEPERFCSPGRLERCRKTINAGVRAQGYAAELALSYCISGDALKPPEYRYEKNGKPVVDGGYISLSHSGKYAAAVYCGEPVGVDIEVMRRISLGIAKRVLTDAEREEFGFYGGDRYLLRKFVIKEAYSKLTGEGLGCGFREIEEIEGKLLRGRKPVGYAFEFEPEYALGCIVTETKLENGDIELVYLTDELIRKADEATE